MRRSLTPKKVLLFLYVWLFSLAALAQEQEITGKVIDESTNEPLIGATILVKGTLSGVTTNIDGDFSVQAPLDAVLQVSFVGYITKEVNVAGQTRLSLSLAPDLQELKEVVVIGYGTVKKSDATGSVSVVSAEDFNKGAITSPQELMVGKSAGVVITTSSGAPGGGAQIRIRGGSSFTASNDPLLIVDGVPISDEDVDGNSNLLNFINPNDIETFTVLKDASATAIYGSRASNGVILITTKKGKAGSPLKVSYNGSVSVSTPVDFIDVYSGDEFRKIAYEKNDLYDPETYYKLGTQNTDWQKEIFRTAISHDHSLGLSGSVNKLPYRVSLGYTDQSGILENTDMQRFTGALALNPSLWDDHLKVNVNAKGMLTQNNFGEDKAIGSAINMDPTQPVKDGTDAYDGYFQWPTYGANLGTPNPVEQALAVDNKADVYRFVGNVQLDYKLHFLPDLRANLNLATDYSYGDGHNNRPVTSPSTLTTPRYGKLNEYDNTIKSNLLDFYLNYTKELSVHNINLTAGYSWQHFENKSNSWTKGIYTTEHPDVDSIGSKTHTEYYLVSFFGRANYALMNKYLVTGTVRFDGSSRFAEGNRWGMFPSVALAWKVNEEAFLQDIDIISDLKLRLGWGITGQQNVTDNNYPYMSIYRESAEGNYYKINGEYIPTLRPDAYDPDIKWEETTTQNIALDFGLYDNRITGTLDFYKRVTNDLLNEVTIPSGSNFSNTLLTNVGSLENIGVEASLNIVAVSKKDWSLDVGLNFTHNKNEVTKLLLSDDPDYIGVLEGGDGMTGDFQVTRVGEAAHSFFVNKQVYDAQGNPIEGLYVDLSGEGGTVNGDEEDKYVYHSPVPDYIMGFSFRFNYKDFDLSASARANIGNYVYNKIAATASYDQMQQIGYWKNMPTFLNESQFVKRQFTSDYFIENASFLKVDNISAGYNFKQVAGKVGLRISFTVQNVLTVTKYSGIDPEIEDGIDDNFYPRPRTYMIGFSLNY